MCPVLFISVYSSSLNFVEALFFLIAMVVPRDAIATPKAAIAITIVREPSLKIEAVYLFPAFCDRGTPQTTIELLGFIVKYLVPPPL